MTTREPFPNAYRTTVLCVDSYQDCCLRGRLYHPSLDCPLVFDNLMQFLITMEEHINALNFPQAEAALRTFAPGLPPLRPKDVPLPPQGELATFALQVVFRQHASWQGLVTWLEQGQEQPFRSVLELVLLLHSALQD